VFIDSKAGKATFRSDAEAEAWLKQAPLHAGRFGCKRHLGISSDALECAIEWRAGLRRVTTPCLRNHEPTHESKHEPATGIGSLLSPTRAKAGDGVRSSR
jgi:hypothetical protein